VCTCVCAEQRSCFWPQAQISEGEWRWWEGHNRLSQAISERSEAVFSGAVRSAKLALISPVVGDV